MATSESEELGAPSAAEATVEVVETPSENTEMFDVEMWRHAFSCANLKQLKGDFVDQHGYTDPNLSLWGILTALNQSRKYDDYYKPQLNNNTFVHVSVLFRTWATAICLYLPHISKDGKLTLIVSPFLRENESGSDNLPADINEQDKKLKSFYMLLYQWFPFPNHTIEVFYKTRKIEYYISVEDDVLTFNSVKNSKVKSTAESTTQSTAESTTQSTAESTTQSIAVPVDNPSKPIINSVYLLRQKTKINDLVYYKQDIGSSDEIMENASTITYDKIKEEDYLKSDCKKFLFWMSSCKRQIILITSHEVFSHLPQDYVDYIKSSSSPSSPSSLPILRVVCHSKILQALCKTLFKPDGINELYKKTPGLVWGEKKKKLIADNNMWGIKFKLYNTPADSDTYSLKNKNITKNITLFSGSVKPNPQDLASACEIGCDFGQNRGTACENSMKGEKKPGLFGIFGRNSTYKPEVVEAAGSEVEGAAAVAVAAGGKRKTRRINKQKITRKRKAQKSSKTIRRYSRR